MKQTLKVCELQLSYKPKFKISERPVVSDSQQALKILREQWNEETIQLQEEFKILFLNAANRLLGLQNLALGGMDFTIADTRLIFAAALKAGAQKIIIAHNHPSGSPNPSLADKELTQRIKKGAEILGQNLLDHLILTYNDHYSFADEGLI